MLTNVSLTEWLIRPVRAGKTIRWAFSLQSGGWFNLLFSHRVTAQPPLTWHWPDGWNPVLTNERKQVWSRETAYKVWRSAAVRLWPYRNVSIFLQKMYASALLMFDTKRTWRARPSQSPHPSHSSLVSSLLSKSPPSFVPSSVFNGSIHLPHRRRRAN